MAHATPSLARWAAAALLSVCLVSPLSCADKDATGVMLILDSEMLSGEHRELRNISIDWSRAGNTNVVNSEDGGQLTVDDGSGNVPNISAFPATIAFFDDPDADPKPGDGSLSLLITAEAVTGENKPAQRLRYKTVVSFVEGQIKALPVHLRFSCLDVTDCQDQDGNSVQTCIDGRCQKVPTLQGSVLETYTDETITTLFNPPQCFDASTSGCFRDARNVPLASIRTTVDDKTSCEFNAFIDDANLDAAHLNVGIVWAEANGRYSVLDLDDRGQERNGWTSGQPNDRKLVVNLPRFVCDNIPSLNKDGPGRVKGVVYSYQTSCSSKRSSSYVCAGALNNTSAAGLTDTACVADSSVSTPATFSSPACSACLAAFPSWTACQQDAGCRALLGCQFGCKTPACRTSCLVKSSCLDDSKDKLKALGEDQVAATCAAKCGGS